jgi:glycerate 2-kinase
LNDARKILDAGLAAASPAMHIKKYITQNRLVCSGKSYYTSQYDKLWLVAMGKAADAMAKAAHDILDADGGIIIVPKNTRPAFYNKKFPVIRAGHPTPNQNSVLAAKKIIALLQNAGKDDLVVFLVSGGTSALVCAPAGITLQQKIKTTKILLESGASISEINAIRKHLSGVKGGRILENLHCDAVSYVMSDVVGNDLGAIASGMTYCDKTTFSDCIGIISKYNLGKKLPRPALSGLCRGAQGKIAETPKKPRIPNQIIASNSDCLGIMSKKAKSLGYSVVQYPDVTGDVALAAQKILKKFQTAKKSCLVFGGETTVQVRGRGKGGRNQELVLNMVSKLPANTTVASIGTDGIDGNTEYAGAIFDHAVDYDIAKPYLQNNDSNSFFRKFGGLIRTGPTHTNLQDIGVILQH